MFSRCCSIWLTLFVVIKSCIFCSFQRFSFLFRSLFRRDCDCDVHEFDSLTEGLDRDELNPSGWDATGHFISHHVILLLADCLDLKWSDRDDDTMLPLYFLNAVNHVINTLTSVRLDSVIWIIFIFLKWMCTVGWLI